MALIFQLEKCLSRLDDAFKLTQVEPQATQTM